MGLDIDIDISELPKAKGKIIRAISSTYMHLSGSSFSLRIGTTIMKAEDVVENVIAGLDSAVLKLGNQSPNPLKGWSRVMNVYIKTNTSAALPLYSKMPSEVMKFVKKLSTGELAAVEEEKKDELDQVEEKEEKGTSTERKKKQKKVGEADESKEKKSTKKAKSTIVKELMEEEEPKAQTALGKTKKLKRALDSEPKKSADVPPISLASTPVQSKKKKVSKN